MHTTLLLIGEKSSLYKLYLKITLLLSTVCGAYFGLRQSFIVLSILIFLDSVTRIHATAVKKGIKFNPFRLQFWLVIKSKGLKLALNKALLQYGIYFIMAFIIDKYILNQLVIVNFNDNGYTLPVVTMWICSGIEVWSIGENIEDAGGVNLPKRLVHFLDEKYQQIFKKTKDE